MLHYHDHITAGQDHETFLGQDLSDPLLRIRSGLPQVVEYTYIVHFTSVVGICQRARNTFEASEESFRKRVERVAGHFFHDFALTRGHMTLEEAFYKQNGNSLCSFPFLPSPQYPLSLLLS